MQDAICALSEEPLSEGDRSENLVRLRMAVGAADLDYRLLESAVDAGVIPLMRRFINSDGISLKDLFECAWIVLCITSENQTHRVMETSLIPDMMNKVQETYGESHAWREFAFNVLWTISNCLGDQDTAQSALLIPNLITFLDQCTSIATAPGNQETMIWTMVNLAKAHKDDPVKLREILIAYPDMMAWVRSTVHMDEATCSQGLWFLNFLEEKGIQDVTTVTGSDAAKWMSLLRGTDNSDLIPTTMTALCDYASQHDCLDLYESGGYMDILLEKDIATTSLALRTISNMLTEDHAHGIWIAHQWVFDHAVACAANADLSRASRKEAAHCILSIIRASDKVEDRHVAPLLAAAQEFPSVVARMQDVLSALPPSDATGL